MKRKNIFTRLLLLLFIILSYSSCQKQDSLDELLPEMPDLSGENANDSIIENLISNMVEVKGGSFWMYNTSDEDYANSEDFDKTHQVELSSFAINKYEVTQAEWIAVMGNNPSKSKGNNLPIQCISWNDSQVFITKLNEMTGKQFRLPTEAEWEYAARGGEKSKGYCYSGSDILKEVSWGCGGFSSRIRDVGGKLPNELGLFDMSGNVCEWCSDWFDYLRSPELQINPTGATTGLYRVVRGGCYYNGSYYLVVSTRNGYKPTVKDRGIGMRLVLTCDSIPSSDK